MDNPPSDAERLRAELDKAERKIEALRELATRRQLRYERRQAELERLRRMLLHRVYRRVLRAIGRQELHAFCLFIGYPRSGHSLLGSLLDAHPDVAIAQGTNVLKLIAAGEVDREQLIAELVGNAVTAADRPGGRRGTGYSYTVPGQWQGDVRHLRVVGSKAGDKATAALGRDPGALARLGRLVGTRVRLLHACRNPFDMIARMALITKDGKPERTVGEAAHYTARLARINADTIASWGDDVLTLRHESFVKDPRAELSKIAAFLGIEPEETWLAGCAEIVFERPHPARHLVQWQPEEREAVEQLIARHEFFHGYSWTSDE